MPFLASPRPLRIAREAGFAMPRLEMLEAELRFLERSEGIGL